MKKEMKRMKNKLYIVALLSIITLRLSAQPFQTTVEYNAIQSQQMIKSGSTYNGTIYEPFCTTTPSEQSAVGAGQPATKKAVARRSGDPWGQNQDGGITDDEGSPIGDAVIPLLAMALAFAGVIAMRRRKEAKD